MMAKPSNLRAYSQEDGNREEIHSVSDEIVVPEFNIFEVYGLEEVRQLGSNFNSYYWYPRLHNAYTEHCSLALLATSNNTDKSHSKTSQESVPDSG